MTHHYKESLNNMRLITHLIVMSKRGLRGGAGLTYKN